MSILLFRGSCLTFTCKCVLCMCIICLVIVIQSSLGWESGNNNNQANGSAAEPVWTMCILSVSELLILLYYWEKSKNIKQSLENDICDMSIFFKQRAQDDMFCSFTLPVKECCVFLSYICGNRSKGHDLSRTSLKVLLRMEWWGTQIFPYVYNQN